MPLTQCGNTSCAKDATQTVLKACPRCKTVAYCSRECQTTGWQTHKSNCRRQNYVIKAHLMPGGIKNPEIVRTLSCPAGTTLYHLHMALQVAFGWATCHLFDFSVMDDVVDTRKHKYKLHQLLDKPEFRGGDFMYIYDLGDDWEHHLTITGRAAGTDDFVCLSGSGHEAAEDVGGFVGWEQLKKAYRAARPNAEQRERKLWYEDQAMNGDPEGLSGDRINFWDRDQVNSKLKGLCKADFSNEFSGFY